jgi:hypothetical protein
MCSCPTASSPVSTVTKRRVRLAEVNAVSGGDLGPRAVHRRALIILGVRWYRYKLSLCALVEMMAERGLSLAHATIMR